MIIYYICTFERTAIILKSGSVGTRSECPATQLPDDDTMLSLAFEFAGSGKPICKHVFPPDTNVEEVEAFIQAKVRDGPLPIAVELFNNYDFEKPLKDPLDPNLTIVTVVRKDHPKVAELKQEFAQNPNVLARYTDDVEATKILLHLGADPNATDSGGRTGLHFSSRNGRVEITGLLLEAKANPNAQTNDEWTGLHLSSSRGRVETTRLLLEAKADPNAKDKYGETGLHWSSNYGHVEIVRLLLEAKADPTVQDKNGEMPVDLCKVNSDVYNLLLRAMKQAR